MRQHLRPEMRLEARLLKRFMKGIRSYGAEIRVGGFSGMLVETLILHYKSFLGTLVQASKWEPVIFLDLEKPTSNQDSRPRDICSPWVVIDRLTPHVNLAYAVRAATLV